MKNYVQPEINISVYSQVDVILASVGKDGLIGDSDWGFGED